jgi:hypothetical protein
MGKMPRMHVKTRPTKDLKEELMNMTLDYNHALRAIRKCYEHVGFKIGDRTPGQDFARDFKFDIENSFHAALFAFIDELTALTRITSFYFLSVALEKHPHGIIFYRVCISSMKALASARLLCSCGLDINARLQIRLLYENSILWARLLHDENAMEEFIQAMNPAAANKFWHKYLSKEKTEKYLDAEVAKTGRIWLGGMNEIVKDLKEKIGPASHPSHLAAYFDTLNDWKTEQYEVLGSPDEASTFTLGSTILAASIPFCIVPAPIYDYPYSASFSAGSMFPKLTYKHTLGWPEYCCKVREIVPVIFLIATRFIDGFTAQDAEAPLV